MSGLSYALRILVLQGLRNTCPEISFSHACSMLAGFFKILFIIFFVWMIYDIWKIFRRLRSASSKDSSSQSGRGAMGRGEKDITRKAEIISERRMDE